MSVYERLGVDRVINASGRMTHLGGATLSAPVVAAMAEASTTYAELAQLKRQAGRRVAELAGAEDGVITSGASAGIVLMVAAVVAGTDPVRVAALPNAAWEPRGIVIQAGHLVNFGAPVSQMVAIGGGAVAAVGSVNLVGADEIRSAIDARTAAVLFIQSHHAVQKGMVDLARVIEIAHGKNVPVLVDAAAEEDLRRYVAMGADLVAYSGGKAFEGPTSGLVVGRGDLIAACRAQERGVARPMKVGKEAIAGLVAALEAYVSRDDAAQRAVWDGYVETMRDGLKDLPYLRLSLEADEAGRDIRRLAVRAAQDAPFGVADLVADLAAGRPAVIVRDHHLREGVFHLDPRPLSEDDPRIVVERLRAIVNARAEGK